ncbi:hypothetical protein F5878DRAFT_668156 [Lentinula raphanica]|uniref:Uncharacterized protein n=1 Tax=Lentinula raphanica TaxID=153919 RepID=A0AA38U277_9AGAR|nr:hypothetical protein F5878DRAFT_668156 [Lentinula raphanica]
MIFGSATSTVTQMASDVTKVDALKQIFASQYGPRDTLYSVFLDGTREEITGMLILFGIAFCFLLGLGLIVFSTVKMCYCAAARTCSWVYRCNPWTRIYELERREKAMQLQEAMVARQMQSLALDVEIGVCKRLSEILKRSVASAEDREFELEKEKECLLEETFRDERDAPDQTLVRHRLPTMEPEH